MNAILGFSQLLLRDPQLTGYQRQQLTTVSRSGEHLLEIINDILEMARIESGRTTLNPTTFDLRQMLDELERMFSLRTAGKNLSFRVKHDGELPYRALADQTRLRQVFINLLGNAVKFTPSGGGVVLRVGVTPEVDGMLRLRAEVEDDGMGISAQDQEKLFQPFFQASSGKQITGGTGLGLAISREFVRLMGGDLTVSSRLGAGSTFRFHVRIGPGEPSALLANSVPAPRVLYLLPGQPACRVLVVDDLPVNRDLLLRLLSPLGFELRTAADGADAVAQCQAWSPHLVLLDLRMPIMDGYEAARRIRAAHGSAVKLIAVSASVFAEHRLLALDAGIDLFLGKPFQDADLLEQIRKLTGIDYVYERSPSAADTIQPDNRTTRPAASDIRALPADLVTRLREATRSAEYDEMLALVTQVTALNPALGRQFRDWVEQYDYVTLQQALSSATTPEEART